MPLKEKYIHTVQCAFARGDGDGRKMTQNERRLFLIRKLLSERAQYSGVFIPQQQGEQKTLLRALMNLRAPRPVGDDFLRVQDAYLRQEISARGVTKFSTLSPEQPQLYLWQGDITLLEIDAIVNAANSQMLGCFVPCHGCIDNAIHTFAGVQLRLHCAEMMDRQGALEKAGTAKITPAFNLPSKYIVHTVGPFVSGAPTARDEALLASCYRSCLTLAQENRVQAIAFCCISTGEFHFPNEMAAQIAVKTVEDYISETQSPIKVLFNVFKEEDYEIYKNLLK